MKTITMSEFRAEPGERLTDIKRDRTSFLITKSGKPAAMLVPIDETIVIDSSGQIHGEKPLTMCRDLGDEY